jgi:hypothetical protein
MGGPASPESATVEAPEYHDFEIPKSVPTAQATRLVFIGVCNLQDDTVFEVSNNQYSLSGTAVHLEDRCPTDRHGYLDEQV